MKVQYSQVIKLLNNFVTAFFKFVYRGNDFRKDYGKLGVLCIMYEWYHRLFGVKELQIYHWQLRQEKYFL